MLGGGENTIFVDGSVSKSSSWDNSAMASSLFAMVDDDKLLTFSGRKVSFGEV